jgi:YidC/Oxa1 family membrane protein insertase
VDNQRNIILAVLLTALVLFGWDAGMRYIYPQSDKPRQAQTEQAKADSAPKDAVKHTREGGLTDAGDIALEKQDLKQALAAGGRLPIDAPARAGAINLKGAIVDHHGTPPPTQ